MLEQPYGLCLDESHYHVAQDLTDGVESFVRCADVIETGVVQEYLLHNEYCYRFGQLASGLHDPQAQRNDLGGQKESDRW